MNSNRESGIETIQKMAIAVLVVVSVITVIGLFSFGAAEEVLTALSATMTGLMPM